MFWLAWAVFITCPGLMIAGIPMGVINCITKNAILQWIGGALSFGCYLAFVFGVPYWCIIRPRLMRRKHQQQINAADAVIAKLFNPL